MGARIPTKSTATGSEPGSGGIPSPARSSGSTSEVLRAISALRERIEKLEAREDLSATGARELAALKDKITMLESKIETAGANDHGHAKGSGHEATPPAPSRPAYSPFDPRSW